LKVNAHTRELAVSKPDQKTNDVVTEALNDVSKYVTAPDKENLMQIARRARKQANAFQLPGNPKNTKKVWLLIFN
jgi:hypothetical protein